MTTHLDKVILRERTSQRWLAPFGLFALIVTIGFAIAMVLVYR
ncbi:MAG: hypothetical protein JWO36_6155 [Myxococcales bacterium]|nr:hypothetical protein [Myxococcales bacterium]